MSHHSAAAFVADATPSGYVESMMKNTTLILLVSCCALLLASTPAHADTFSPVARVIPAESAYAVIWREGAGPTETEAHQKSPPLQALEYLGATLVSLTTGVTDDFRDFGVDLAGDMALFAAGSSPVLVVSIQDAERFTERMKTASASAREVVTEDDVTTLRFDTLQISYAIQPRGWTRYAFILFHDDARDDLDRVLDSVSEGGPSLADSQHLSDALALLDDTPDVLGIIHTPALDAVRLAEAREAMTPWKTALEPSDEARDAAQAARDAWLETCASAGRVITDAVPVLAIAETRRDNHIDLDVVAPLSLQARLFTKALLPSLSLKGTDSLFHQSDFGMAFHINLRALELLPPLDAASLGRCPNLSTFAAFAGSLRDRVLVSDAADVFTGPIVMGLNARKLSAWSSENALVVRLETGAPEAAMEGFGIFLKALGYDKKSVWGGGQADLAEYTLSESEIEKSTLKALMTPYAKHIAMTRKGGHMVLAGGEDEPKIGSIAEVLEDEPVVDWDAFARLRLNGGVVFEAFARYVALNKLDTLLTEGARVTFIDRLATIESLTLDASITSKGLKIHTEIVQTPQAESSP